MVLTWHCVDQAQSVSGDVGVDLTELNVRVLIRQKTDPAYSMGLGR